MRTEPTIDEAGLEQARIRRAYARRISGPPDATVAAAHVFHAQTRERAAIALLRRHRLLPLTRARILEVGCGTGAWLRDFVKWGADPRRVCGVDVRPGVLAEARRRCAPGVGLAQGNGMYLPFCDGTWDVVVQSTVITSILDQGLRQRVAGEMRRVLRPGGVIVWYDFRIDNPANRDVRGVSRRDLRRLFPGCAVDARRVTLAPPLARALADRSGLACDLLARIGWLCTHDLAAITGSGVPAEERSHAD